VEIGQYEAMADVTEQLRWFGQYVADSMVVEIESWKEGKLGSAYPVEESLSGSDWLYIVDTYEDPKERILSLVEDDEIPF